MVAIGSRSEDRAGDAADRVRAAVPDARIRGAANRDVAQECDVAVAALPYKALFATIQELRADLEGKLIVSVVAAIEFIDGRPQPIQIPAGSAAQEIAQLLPGSKIVSGLQTLSADKLADASATLDEDTIICGDNADARHAIMQLAERINGIRALSGGRLSNSYYPEQLVGMLATLNRIHKARAGFRLVDLGT